MEEKVIFTDRENKALENIDTNDLKIVKNNDK